MNKIDQKVKEAKETLVIKQKRQSRIFKSIHRLKAEVREIRTTIRDCESVIKLFGDK